jgi:hypothetical protein
MRFKLRITVILAAALAVFGAAAALGGQYDDTEYHEYHPIVIYTEDADVLPMEMSGRLYLPWRLVAEGLGAVVEWLPQMVLVELGGRTYNFMGDAIGTVISGRTMVTAAFF